VHRVLLTDSISPAGRGSSRRRAEIIRSPERTRRLSGASPAMPRASSPAASFPDDIIAAAPRLRAVVVHGTGTDLVPIADATARGVMVANLPGGNAQSVAEYCVLAMLMLARNVLAITNALHAGPWDAARLRGTAAHEISGMTLGIVGVAKLAGGWRESAGRALACEVLGNRRGWTACAGAEPVRLDDLLPASDFVVVTCPLHPKRIIFSIEKGWD